MDDQILWGEIKSNFLEKNLYLLGFIFCFTAGMIFLSAFVGYNFSLLYSIITISCLFTFFIVGIYFFSDTKYCTYPDRVGIGNNQIHFKQGKREFIIQYKNIKRINVYFHKYFEIKLISPGIVISYRLSSEVIDKIKLDYYKPLRK